MNKYDKASSQDYFDSDLYRKNMIKIQIIILIIITLIKWWLGIVYIFGWSWGFNIGYELRKLEYVERLHEDY